jgi:hypothetical protein
MNFWNIFAVLCVTGCSLFEAETPTNSFRQIKESACKGDADQFYSRVDYGSIEERLRRKLLAENDSWEKVSAKLANARQGWEGDKRLGPSGNWCGAFLTYSEGTKVSWRTPTGEQKEGVFELVNGKYTLVELTRVYRWYGM